MFHEVVKNYDYHKLYRYLKIHHIALDEVEYCLLSNRRLMVIRRKEHYPISLIIDGVLQEENLKGLHKDRKWLEEELLKEKLEFSKVNYAFFMQNKIYFIA